MSSLSSNPEKPLRGDRDAAAALALTALAWTLSEDIRARRLLDLTGLTPEGLRAGAGEFHILGAVLDFLAGHEPDLIACADATGYKPADLITARDILQA